MEMLQKDIPIGCCVNVHWRKMEGDGDKESGTYTVLQTGQQQRYQLSEHYIIFKTELPDI